MAQLFIYLRHGAYDSGASNRDREPLEPLGERQAARAGQAIRRWLVGHNRQIDRVVWTGKQRTLQTAQTALGELAPPEDRWVRASGGRSLATLFVKIDAWRAELPEDGVLLFSGHGGNYQQLCRWCGQGTVGDDLDHGSVLILERVDCEWSHHLDFTPELQRKA